MFLKKQCKVLLTCLFSCIVFVSNAQMVPISGHLSDQVVQGPCYIFATVAALESNAIQNGASTGINFNEWQFYSSCVMGSLGSTAQAMIPTTIEHVGTYGANSKPHQSPSPLTCPNPDQNSTVTCIADFNCALNNTWCQNNQIYYSTGDNGPCLDNEGNGFEFTSNGGTPYTITPDQSGELWEKRTFPENFIVNKQAYAKSKLNKGIGVIANFSVWGSGGGAHSIFIYGTDGGNTWYWKDSWPNNPSASSGSLPWAKLTSFYSITGQVVLSSSNSCNLSINGTPKVKANSTFTLSGGVGSISWAVGNNLTIVSGQGTSSIVVAPNTCSHTSSFIEATSHNGQCTELINVTVDGRSPKPNKIAVLSPNWSANGKTCPNTELELEAFVPSFSGTLTYEWSISGATLLSGQGTPSVVVKTNSSNSYLSFKVRTRRNSCPNSGWFTRSGYSSSSNPGCSGGGGGGFRQSINHLHFDDFFNQHPEMNSAHIGIYSLSGQQYYVGTLEAGNASLSLNEIQATGVVVIRLIDPVTGISKSFKQWIKN